MLKYDKFKVLRFSVAHFSFRITYTRLTSQYFRDTNFFKKKKEKKKTATKHSN